MATEISMNLQQYPMAQRIELWPIDKLIPYARNPGRTQTRRLRRSPPASRRSVSTTQFWWTPRRASSPATAASSPRGSCSSTEVPVIVLDHLTEAQKRAYIIADNQLALNAGWDEELLRLELAALQEEDFNLESDRLRGRGTGATARCAGCCRRDSRMRMRFPSSHRHAGLACSAIFGFLATHKLLVRRCH